jgi:hypothetical protein
MSNPLQETPNTQDLLYFSNDAATMVQIVSPSNPLPTYSTGYLSYNTAANTAGYQVKTGAGVLRGFSVNTVGLTSTVTFYDGISTGGTKLGTFSTLAQNSVQLNLAFTTGLFVVLTGGTPADITIAYT